MKQLSAMKDQNVLVEHVDCEEMTVTFSNGLTLPVHNFFDADGVAADEPVDGGYAEFGDDEHGYGIYTVRLISEEEYEDAQQERQASSLHGSGRA